MKISEFILLFAERSRKMKDRIRWEVTPVGGLRGFSSKGLRFCPISFIFYTEEKMYIEDWMSDLASEHLGLSAKSHCALIKAIDATVDCSDKIRLALIKACRPKRAAFSKYHKSGLIAADILREKKLNSGELAPRYSPRRVEINAYNFFEMR